MSTLSKIALMGTVARMAGKETAQRAAQKIPVAGAFVPETKSQTATRIGGAAKDVAKGGKADMQAARQGKVKTPTIGANKKPKFNKDITASLQKTHEDMLQLQKEAKKASGIGMGQVFGNALAHAGAGAMMVGGLYGANKLHQKYETEKIWKRLKRENPELTRTQKDRENFEVLQRFSPDIAGNITTARSYLQRAQQTYMAPHEFVKDLASVQDTRRKGGLGYALEDVAKSSIGTGVSLSKESSLAKHAGLIEAMNSVHDL